MTSIETPPPHKRNLSTDLRLLSLSGWTDDDPEALVTAVGELGAVLSRGPASGAAVADVHSLTLAPSAGLVDPCDTSSQPNRSPSHYGSHQSSSEPIIRAHQANQSPLGSHAIKRDHEPSQANQSPYANHTIMRNGLLLCHLGHLAAMLLVLRLLLKRKRSIPRALAMLVLLQCAVANADHVPDPPPSPPALDPYPLPSPPPPLPPPPSPPPITLWRITAGDACQISEYGACVTDGPGRYGSDEACTVTAVRDLTLSATQYEVSGRTAETSCADYVSIGGSKYCNSGTAQFSGLQMIAGQTLQWYAMRRWRMPVSRRPPYMQGFVICAVAAVNAPYTPPPPSPSPPLPSPPPPDGDLAHQSLSSRWISAGSFHTVRMLSLNRDQNAFDLMCSCR